jgi:glycosyltransferase involved in cell wall biosynthesis
MCALEEFQLKRPDVGIDIVGGSGTWPGIEAVWHGTVRPAQMIDLYRRSSVGLCLSFTNVSLVPFEMLAAGCPVVVNENSLSRGELSSPCVTHASPDPRSIAIALSEEVDRVHAERRHQARSSACVRPWESAMDEAVGIIMRHLPVYAM